MRITSALLTGQMHKATRGLRLPEGYYWELYTIKKDSRNVYELWISDSGGPVWSPYGKRGRDAAEFLAFLEGLIAFGDAKTYIGIRLGGEL